MFSSPLSNQPQPSGLSHHVCIRESANRVRPGPNAQNASIRVWHILSLLGTIPLSGGFDQRKDRLPDVLGKFGPCGNDSGQIVGSAMPVHRLAYMLRPLRLVSAYATIGYVILQRPFKP